VLNITGSPLLLLGVVFGERSRNDAGAGGAEPSAAKGKGACDLEAPSGVGEQ
jgi:hypothetical protein